MKDEELEFEKTSSKEKDGYISLEHYMKVCKERNSTLLKEEKNQLQNELDALLLYLLKDY